VGHYIVLDTSAEHRRMALLDEAAALHVAQAVDDVPPVGIALSGAAASLGRTTLCCVETGKSFPVDFQLVGATYRPVFQQLHRSTDP